MLSGCPEHSVILLCLKASQTNQLFPSGLFGDLVVTFFRLLQRAYRKDGEKPFNGTGSGRIRGHRFKLKKPDLD